MPRAPHLAELYLRYGSSVLRRARVLMGNESDAQDVVQQIFCALAEKPAQFEGRSGMLTWLYSATNHLCLNRMRDARRRAELLRQHATRDGRARELGPEDMTQLRAALARMPPQLAEVLIYYHCDHMSQAEIAEQLGCSRRHVGDLLERARAFMTGVAP